MPDKQIETIQGGKPPKGWEVHHIFSLDDGGTNAHDNFVLIREAEHKVFTNYQRSMTRGMKVGDSRTMMWPIVEGSIYPPTH